jgi:hypothetical protein
MNLHAKPFTELFGWTWYLPEDDPDDRGTGWIEIGPLDEYETLSGGNLCEIICRNYDSVKVDHPEWIETKEATATLIVNALNVCAEATAIADAIELLAGIDEGEHTDRDALLRLAARVRAADPIAAGGDATVR